MKLAILGADRTTLEIARAAARSGEHEIAWLAEVGGPDEAAARELRAVAAQARPADTWEALLDPNLVDAVVVASGNEDVRAEQLRKLVQVGVPLLVAHPVVDSMLVYFELDMIRRETGSVLIPFLPDRLHPGVARLSEAFGRGSDSEIGLPEQLVFERHLGDRSRPSVRWQFARDVDTMRAICGDVLRLGAMGGSGDSGYQSLGVQMTGLTELLLRWSVAPADAEAWARLSLLGADGRMVLTMHAGAASWTLSISSARSTDTITYDAWDPATAALERLQAEAVEPQWVDAARSIELMETVDRSLKRGRTLDLHNEDFSEEGTFKGTMASVGCGLLIAGLLLLMVIALAEDVARALRLRIPLIEKWPYILLALLGVFLMMQLLSLLIKKDRGGEV